jgi:hypothetical protein
MAVNTPGMSPNPADYQGVKVLNEEAFSRVRQNSGVAAEIRRGAPTIGTQASVWLSASGRDAEGGTERLAKCSQERNGANRGPDGSRGDCHFTISLVTSARAGKRNGRGREGEGADRQPV